MDNFFEKQTRREIKEIQIAPILDMLVAVIFFLLLSTSFIEYTKQTLPPSGVSTIADPVAPPPLTPKLLVSKKDKHMNLSLLWLGAEPGQIAKELVLKEDSENIRGLTQGASDLAASFKNKFASEKSIQVSFSANVKYQEVISIMDGIREKIPDIILISYTSAMKN